jgi:cell division protease FtsH
MTLAENIDIAVVAKRTPRLVGADLANIANDAAVMAV